MLTRSLKMLFAVGLIVVVWAVSPSPGPVRILRFDANVGSVKAGEKATLCYGVENAKSVLISPPVAGADPALRRCLEIVPLHTTHYTILAEGFDGRVVVQSFTLTVVRPQAAPPNPLLYAFRKSTNVIHSRANWVKVTASDRTRKNCDLPNSLG